MTKDKSYTLITGGSGGIGLELARQFAKNGHNLLLVARSQERLEIIANDLSETYNVDVKTIAQDLSLPGSATQLFAKTGKAGYEVETLVNNAGVGDLAYFPEADMERETTMMELNMVALTQLTKLYLPGMIKRKNGRVLNVASMAAFVPGPYMAVYHASKAYALSFSQAIHAELEGTGVTVTVLCPGPTRTGWARGAGMGEKAFTGASTMDAETVARAGYEGAMTGKSVVFASRRHRLVIAALRLMPLGQLTKTTRWKKYLKKD